MELHILNLIFVKGIPIEEMLTMDNLHDNNLLCWIKISIYCLMNTGQFMLEKNFETKQTMITYDLLLTIKSWKTNFVTKWFLKDATMRKMNHW